MSPKGIMTYIFSYRHDTEKLNKLVFIKCN